MWTLEVYRVITNIGGWHVVGKFGDTRQLLNTICETYSLEQRAISPTGNIYSINWADDPNDSEMVIPEIGEHCTNWPQKIGDIRG